MDQFLKYNVSTQNYYKSGMIPLPELCNGFVLKNVGNTLLKWSDDVLQPGESKSIGGNAAEIYIGRLDIVFENQAVQPTPVKRIAAVTTKFYIQGSEYDK